MNEEVYFGRFKEHARCLNCQFSINKIQAGRPTKIFSEHIHAYFEKKDAEAKLIRCAKHHQNVDTDDVCRKWELADSIRNVQINGNGSTAPTKRKLLQKVLSAYRRDVERLEEELRKMPDDSRFSAARATRKKLLADTHESINYFQEQLQETPYTETDSRIDSHSGPSIQHDLRGNNWKRIMATARRFTKSVKFAEETKTAQQKIKVPASAIVQLPRERRIITTRRATLRLNTHHITVITQRWTREPSDILHVSLETSLNEQKPCSVNSQKTNLKKPVPC